jgi:stearoyl-CoA desaturase (delta-9 desaturase)
MSTILRKVIIITMVVGPLIATVYAIYLGWNGIVRMLDLVLLASLYCFTAIGVTIGYHRYLTHASFRTNRVLKFVLVILGCVSLEGAPITWVANHRKHHAFSDREGDLHSPHLSRNIVLGFMHAHVGWMIEGRAADTQKWAPDLLQDVDIKFINKTTALWVILGLLVPFLIGGWSGLLWGGLVRILLTHHVTWSVNSVCHVFGSRPFRTKDRSSNHWLVGLLAFGEGGHNTHHASPRSARHGIFWWHFDLSWVIIRALANLGWIFDVYTLDPTDLKQALRVEAPGIKVIKVYPLTGI